MKRRPRPTFENLGSLITYHDNGENCCLGFLLNFEGHGVYDANFGKVDISPEHAAVHNAALSQALIEGLDRRCEIGQGGTFYLIGGKVQTFTGDLVSDRVSLNGKSITFERGGKEYRGRLGNADCFNFRRIR